MEALQACPQDEPIAGELAAVVLEVGAGGYDEEGLLSASVVGAQGVEHYADLAGVGGAGEEGDGHGRQWWRTHPTPRGASTPGRGGRGRPCGGLGGGDGLGGVYAADCAATASVAASSAGASAAASGAVS